MRRMQGAWGWAKGPSGWTDHGGAARRWLIGLLVTVLVAWLMFAAADEYADWRWFDSLGHADALARRWAVGAEGTTRCPRFRPGPPGRAW